MPKKKQSDSSIVHSPKSKRQVSKPRRRPIEAEIIEDDWEDEDDEFYQPQMARRKKKQVRRIVSSSINLGAAVADLIFDIWDVID